ncbi:hypothetical protein ACHQM5_005934 [Ranunculus cassubicifolius]
MMKKENQKEMETAMVAVGVVLVIAGVKHGLTNLVEQWRAMMFLCLNLLLLTILLTSHHTNSPKNRVHNTSKPIKKTGRMNVKSKKMKRKCSGGTGTGMTTTTSWPLQVEDIFKVEETHVFVAPEMAKTEVIVAHDDIEDVDETQNVSKEELNARVESFILMFRQQLALDAQGKIDRVRLDMK